MGLKPWLSLVGMMGVLCSSGFSQGTDRLHCLLVLGCDDAAIHESSRLLRSGNFSVSEACLILQSLSKSRRYDDWFKAYQCCIEKYPQLTYDRDVLEHLGRSILEDGSYHSSAMVRAMSLSVAGFVRDARLLSVCHRGFVDDSILVRTLALQLATMYGDEESKHLVVQTIRDDPSSSVRKTAYQAAVALRLFDAVPQLLCRFEDQNLDAEEREDALQAWITLTRQTASRPSEKELSCTRHGAALRCEMMVQGLLPWDGTVLLGFLSSHDTHIIKSALQGLLFCEVGSLPEGEAIIALVQALSKHTLPEVKFKAATVLHVLGERSGTDMLHDGLRSSSDHLHQIIAENLVDLGLLAVPWAQQYIGIISSEQAKFDMAILLLLGRESIEEAGDVVSRHLSQPYFSYGIRKFLMSSSWDATYESLRPVTGVFMHKEIVHQLIRLLIQSGYSKACAVLEQVVADRLDQDRYMFFYDLWEEGKSTSYLSQAKSTMLDRLVCSLIHLATHSDSDSLEEVMRLYPECSWTDRVHILEALACYGHPGLMPFILKCCCCENLATLRVAAAGAVFALLRS